MSNLDLAHKTILVTGAAGFIGANLSHRLLDECGHTRQICCVAVYKDKGAFLENDGKRV